MSLEQRIQRRLRELEASLASELGGGADPDGYNVGWLEGSLYELQQLSAPHPTQTLIERDGDWHCPACGIWIDPTEVGCGCGRTRPSAR